MSTEFKKGDRVVFVEDGATLATYDDDNPTSRTPWVKLDTGERAVALREAIAPAEPETPAPLDPSKVKAGDTVTLEMGTALVRDVVIEVKKRGEGQFLFYTGETPDPLIPGTYYLVNPGAWTLTAHTPAPEPEPEWRPGTLVKGTVVVDQTHDAVELEHDVQMMRVTHVDGVGRAFVSAGGDIIEPHHVTDVRPLVVIDPATVDVKAIGAALRATVSSVFSWEEVARTALAEVGIEVPR